MQSITTQRQKGQVENQNEYSLLRTSKEVVKKSLSNIIIYDNIERERERERESKALAGSKE